MYFEKLKQAFYLNDDYSLENLSRFYEKEKNDSNKDIDSVEPSEQFTLVEIMSNLREYGLNEDKSKELKTYNLDELIKRIDDKIAELEAKEKQTRRFFRRFEKANTNVAEQRKHTKKDISKHLQKLAPEDCFSETYKVRYFKTVLNLLINYYSFEVAQEPENWNDIFFKGNLIFKDQLFSLIYKIINAIIQHSEKEEYFLQKCKESVKNQLKEYVDKTILYPKDLSRFRIYGQIISFVIAIEQNDNIQTYQQINEKEAISYISYFLAENFWRKGAPSVATGIQFAKNGLIIRNRADRQDAFNILSLCAIDAGEYKQLAYDTYFSWLNCCVVGELTELLPPDFFKDDLETVWRKDEGKHQESLMRNNFAYLCEKISETYEINSPRRKLFHKIAVREIEKAIALNPNNPDYYCTYGSLLSGNAEKNYVEALKQYDKYYYLSKRNNNERLGSLRMSCTTLLQELAENYSNYLYHSEYSDCSFSQWTKSQSIKDKIIKLTEKLNKYRLIPSLNISKGVEEQDEEVNREDWKDIFELQDRMQKYIKSPKMQNLGYMLLLIDEIPSIIKEYLRRYEYSTIDYYTRECDLDKDVNDGLRKDIKTIAYYTTLNTVRYIFDDLYQFSSDHALQKAGEKEDGKNCLTVMHAKYMNDPHEGLTLLNVFLRDINKLKSENMLFPNDSTALFREEIYKDHFVFLKSFTEHTDSLIMWNRYATDFANGGRDSNGCCVQFDTGMFNSLVDSDGSGKATTKTKSVVEDDDYFLYRVVYISKSDIIEEKHNKGLDPRVNIYYKALRSLITDVNKYLCANDIKEILGDDLDEFIVYIKSFLQQALRRIIFLFKDDAYSEEAEFRLVFTRTAAQQGTLRLIPGFPEKLCINPYFQVYISRIIFGPNVRDQEIWRPYFQYQLNKMWKKHPELLDNPKIAPQEKYRIESSTIHYNT